MPFSRPAALKPAADALAGPRSLRPLIRLASPLVSATEHRVHAILATRIVTAIATARPPVPALAIAGAALLILASTAVRAETLEQKTPTLTVTATGEAAGAPDQARFTFAVETTARAAADAMTRNSTRMAQAFDALENAGVAADDVRTTSLTLTPERNRQSSTPRRAYEIVGYTARNQASVTVRNLDALGTVLDALVRNGVNALGNVSFSISDTGQLENQARSAAVAAARTKAETMAEAMGTDILRLLRLSEDRGAAPRPMMQARMERATASAVPVAAGGTQTLRVQVRAVFEITGDLAPGD